MRCTRHPHQGNPNQRDIVAWYVLPPPSEHEMLVPEMYQDMWTAAKGMYKLEPVVADGGEIIIYAPHITEFSTTHDDRSSAVTNGRLSWWRMSRRPCRWSRGVRSGWTTHTLIASSCSYR